MGVQNKQMVSKIMIDNTHDNAEPTLTFRNVLGRDHSCDLHKIPTKSRTKKKKKKTRGWFAGKCLISGPDTLRSYKQENRDGGKFLFVHIKTRVNHLTHLSHTAPQWQKGITDNFVKIELSPLLRPEWQYLSVEIIKHPILALQTLKISVQKISFMYKSMGAKHSNWQFSQNNQYVSYALLSLGGQHSGSIHGQNDSKMC